MLGHPISEPAVSKVGEGGEQHNIIQVHLVYIPGGPAVSEEFETSDAFSDV